MESTLRKQRWGWEYVSKNGNKYSVGTVTEEFNVIVDDFEDINELFDYDALIHSHLVDYVYGDLETDTDNIKEWLDERIERYENHERTVRFYTNIIDRDDCDVLYECYIGLQEEGGAKAKRIEMDTMMRFAEEVKGGR